MDSTWETLTLVPQGSTVYLNCTISRNEQTPVWTIYLGGTDTATQFGFPQSIALLNSRGFFQLETVETDTTKTIRLHITNTTSASANNGTVIGCGDASSAMLIYNTNLIIYGELVFVNIYIMTGQARSTLLTLDNVCNII